MDLITIEADRLKELFVEAYEAGWYGSKELADSVADELVKRAWSDKLGIDSDQIQIEVMPPPQTIEIEQDGQTIQVAGWEVRIPSLFTDRDGVGTSEE